MSPKNTDNLNSIRNQINKIDNKIHDLLIDRAKAVAEVVKEKKKSSKNNIVIYRPSREQEILHRLLNRHKGNLPQKVLISLWRNIISAYISIQGELQIAYYGNIEKIVNNHFGLYIKKEKKKTAIEAIICISENKSNIAIFPYPDSTDTWWTKLINYNDIFVIGHISKNFYGKPESLILGKQEIDYSDFNVFLYLVVLDLKDIKSYLKYIKTQDYVCIADKDMAKGKSMIMIATKVNSIKAADIKLNTIVNCKFNLEIGPKYIGVHGSFKKENINA